ncbi:MAG: hypothetical protein H6838_02265 [Planctomycetes bacterium]|nr:hypothetical protein [Planctomycetota bacterium]MCB9884284.1 hypothetical protein [Planctomycetota bacterium]
MNGLVTALVPLALAAAAPSAAAQGKLDQPAPPFAPQVFAVGKPIAKLAAGKIHVLGFRQAAIDGLDPAHPFGPWFDSLLGKVEPVLVYSDLKDLTVDKVEKAAAALAKTNVRVAFDVGGKLHEAWSSFNGFQMTSTAVVDKAGKLIWSGDALWLNYVVEAAIAGKDMAKTRAEIDALMARVSAVTGEVESEEALVEVEAIVKQYPPVGLELLPGACINLGDAGEFALQDRIVERAIEAAIQTRAAGSLNEIAWTYVAPRSKREDRKLDLAQKAIEASLALEEPTSDRLDTMARVWFWKGDLDKAIAAQRRSVEAAKNPRARQSKQKILDAYEAEKSGR